MRQSAKRMGQHPRTPRRRRRRRLPAETHRGRELRRACRRRPQPPLASGSRMRMPTPGAADKRGRATLGDRQQRNPVLNTAWPIVLYRPVSKRRRAFRIAFPISNSHPCSPPLASALSLRLCFKAGDKRKFTSGDRHHTSAPYKAVLRVSASNERRLSGTASIRQA